MDSDTTKLAALERRVAALEQRNAEDEEDAVAAIANTDRLLNILKKMCSTQSVPAFSNIPKV